MWIKASKTFFYEAMVISFSQESKCSGQYSQRRRVIDLMLCLGLRDEAMTLLLETEPSNPSYYSDHLLACLVASTSAAESGTPHSTTKLVATNLIAEGKLWQGVQLLCLSNKVRHSTFGNQSNREKWSERLSLVDDCIFLTKLASWCC